MNGGGETIREAPSFESHACIYKDISGEARMAVIGTRVKKFHFGVKAILTLGTAKAEGLIPYLCKDRGLPAPMK